MYMNWNASFNSLKPKYEERSEGSEPRSEKIKKVVKFICEQKTHFQLADDNFISTATMFETRDNGDVGEEEYGMADVKEAQRLAKLVNEKFPNEFKMNLSTCDEWVTLEISEKE